MLRSMRGLGVAATGIVSTVLVFFLALWDARSQAGEAYRRAVKTLLRSPAVLVMAALSLIVWLTLPILTKVDRRDENQARAARTGAKYYSYRRSYRGRHHLVSAGALAS